VVGEFVCVVVWVGGRKGGGGGGGGGGGVEGVNLCCSGAIVDVLSARITRTRHCFFFSRRLI